MNDTTTKALTKRELAMRILTVSIYSPPRHLREKYVAELCTQTRDELIARLARTELSAELYGTRAR